LYLTITVPGGPPDVVSTVTDTHGYVFKIIISGIEMPIGATVNAAVVTGDTSEYTGIPTGFKMINDVISVTFTPSNASKNVTNYTVTWQKELPISTSRRYVHYYAS
jgi:hypothetical protein